MFLDLGERQPIYVDQSLGPLYAFLHQVDEVGSAGEKLRRTSRA
jgi:hypothetical protein